MKSKLFEKILLEKELYRGYRTFNLFDQGGIRPNEKSRKLFTTDDVEHAIMFAEGQTTVGDEKVLEVYDVPDEKVEKVYDLDRDPDGVKEEFTYKVGNVTVQDEKMIDDFLKSEGYPGYKDRDTISEGDGPYVRNLKTSDEYAWYDKENMRPEKRLVSKNGEWSDDDLRTFVDMGSKSADWELYERGHPDYQDGQSEYGEYDEEEDPDEESWDPDQGELDFED